MALTVLKTLILAEDGAVTVDWVVLTAFVVGMCIAIYTTLGNDTHEYSELIGNEMSTRGIPSYLD